MEIKNGGLKMDLERICILNNFITFTVQAKLRSLHDYHLRLLHNSIPVPSGIDIANTIKYFSQTLLSK